MSELISNQTLADGEKPPVIEFPCEYPVKVMGDADDNFQALVVEVVRKHASDLDESRITVRDSSKGTFRSVTVIINATGKPQLKALFDDLKATGKVKMVI